MPSARISGGGGGGGGNCNCNGNGNDYSTGIGSGRGGGCNGDSRVRSSRPSRFLPRCFADKRLALKTGSVCGLGLLVSDPFCGSSTPQRDVVFCMYAWVLLVHVLRV